LLEICVISVGNVNVQVGEVLEWLIYVWWRRITWSKKDYAFKV